MISGSVSGGGDSVRIVEVGGEVEIPDWKALVAATTGIVAAYDMADATETDGKLTSLVDCSGNALDENHVSFSGRDPGPKINSCMDFDGAHLFRGSSAINSDLTESGYFIAWHVWQMKQRSQMIADGDVLTADQRVMGGGNSSGYPGWLAKTPTGNSIDFFADCITGAASSTNSDNDDPGVIKTNGFLGVSECEQSNDGSTFTSRFLHNGELLGVAQNAKPGGAGTLYLTMGGTYYNITPANQFFRIRAMVFADPAVISQTDRDAVRSALMLNFNTVNAYT